MVEVLYRCSDRVRAIAGWWIDAMRFRRVRRLYITSDLGEHMERVVAVETRAGGFTGSTIDREMEAEIIRSAGGDSVPLPGNEYSVYLDEQRVMEQPYIALHELAHVYHMGEIGIRVGARFDIDEPAPVLIPREVFYVYQKILTSVARALNELLADLVALHFDPGYAGFLLSKVQSYTVTAYGALLELMDSPLRHLVPFVNAEAFIVNAAAKPEILGGSALRAYARFRSRPSYRNALALIDSMLEEVRTRFGIAFQKHLVHDPVLGFDIYLLTGRLKLQPLEPSAADPVEQNKKCL